MAVAGRTLLMIGILINSLVYSASGQWVQTNGPCGGSFETITISDSVLYTNVLGRGVFRTGDKGKTWTAINDGLTGKDVLSLASLGNELFAGTELNGMYTYSGNNGRWSHFEPKSDHSFNRIYDMTVHGGKIWAATDNGLMMLYKKNDEWVDSLFHRAYWSQAVAVTDSFIFISSESLLERSADQGATWAACTTGLPQSPILCHMMLDDRSGLIGTETGAYITNDGCNSWSSIGGGMAAEDNFFIHGFSARNDTILFSTSDRIWLSTDRGSTWSDFNSTYTFTNPKRIGLIGTSVFLATSKGIFTSSFSDRKWIDISAGIVSGSVTGMLKAGGVIFAGGNANGQIYRSDDNGTNWTISDSGFDNMSTVHALTFFDSILFAGCEYQSLMQSTDFGRSWTKCTFKMGIALSFIEKDGNLLVGNITAGIQSLAPGGTAFEDANTLLQLQIPDCGCSAPYPTPLAFSAMDSTAFVALESHGIYSSTGKEVAWYAKNNGLTDTNVNTVFAADGVVLAGLRENGIFRSTDRGVSWSSCETNLSGIPVSAFAEHGTTIFAGTGNGVFFSIDSGMTWHNGDTEFNDSIQSLLVDGDHLLAGTSTRGVWRRPLGEFQAGIEKRQLVNRGKNSFVSIQMRGFTFSCRFNLARAELVTLKLYNLQGKMIELLKSSRLPPGEHVFESDLRKYKSGCYVIRFEAGPMCRSTPFIISRHL